jgi:hypothetical protein
MDQIAHLAGKLLIIKRFFVCCKFVPLISR